MSGLSTPSAASSAHNLDTRLHLFTPLQVGAFELKHRIVMAPLTRMRANRPGNEPSALNALYYTQRASEGGLIIAEASQVVSEGQGMPATPGIHTDAQQAGWQLVTDGVHARGGRIFCSCGMWGVFRTHRTNLGVARRWHLRPSRQLAMR